MKMNKYMLLAATALMLVFAGCKSQDPFDSQTENDYPRILYPMSMSGELNTVLENPDAVWIDSVIVSPSAYTTVNWYLDGALVHTGLKIEQSFLSGKYRLLIEAVTTKGLRTERFGSLTVNPYSDAPYSEAKGLERYAFAHGEVALTGTNLDKANKVYLTTDVAGNEPVAEAEPTWHDAGVFKFIVPEISAGTYFVRFADTEGKLYGANILNVISSALVTEGFAEATEGGSINMKGMFLTQVKSLKIQGEGGSFDLNVENATESAVSVALPKDAKAGKYTLTGVQEDGAALQFATADGIVTEVAFTILPAGETEICKGPAEMINWGDVFVDIEVATLAEHIGQQMNVYYEVVEDAPDGYHQMKFVSAPSWAYGGDGNPSMPDAPFIDNFEEATGKISFTVTQAMYDACAEDGGGLRITGYGYKVVKVTVGSGIKETEICKGPAEMINWGDVFVDIEVATLGDIIGRQMNVHYQVVADAPDGYHQMKFVSAPSWAYGGDGNPSMPDASFYDHFDEDEGVVSFKVTQTLYDACAEDGGGLRITGYGYKIVKVTYN